MKKIKQITPSVLVLFSFFILGTPAFAYVASSTSYRIQADSINIGGVLSTSTSFRAEDTLGESGVGTSSSASYNIKAGYQQMQQTYLAVTVPSNVSLSPNIPTLGGGAANGVASWTVTTDNISGYSMSIRSSGAPAMISGANSFLDYVPAGAPPDFTFTTPSASRRFGFSPEGTDISQRFRDNGAVCNAGALDTTSACWDPLAASPANIASRATPNHPLGTLTTVRFRAESGATNVQPVGSYQATTTLTVIAI